MYSDQRAFYTAQHNNDGGLEDEQSADMVHNRLYRLKAQQDRKLKEKQSYK